MRHFLIFQVQEWLYTDGEDATATEFQERLNLLKATADPIFFRYPLFSCYYFFFFWLGQLYSEQSCIIRA